MTEFGYRTASGSFILMVMVVVEGRERLCKRDYIKGMH